MSSFKEIIFFGLFLFFLAVVFSSFSLSYTGNIVKENFSAQELLQNPDPIINDYNSRFENIPQFAKNLLGNEKINLIVILANNQTKNLALTTKEGKIIEYKSELYKDAAFTITTSAETIDKIAKAGDPKTEFKTNVLKNNIKIEPNGFEQTVKYYAAISVLKISSWF